ncbi:MAG TPA: hypothetical protein VMH41_02155 [Mycobacteriales bacterium]|nr:hypothetical protein [Mycobacteriales bacterium]
MSESMATPTSPSLAMRLLTAGVPLSLLLDLAVPGGPDSTAILADEALLVGRAKP